MPHPVLSDDNDVVPHGRESFVKLDYMVTESSGHSSTYLPGLIQVENPMDQGSRWSSPANDQNQFLLLRLERPSLVRTITFGKFFKTHVCNLKEFRVLAGSSPASLFEVVHSGLRNDSEAETFPFAYSQAIDYYCPIQYVRIVPITAWGSNFNFSIWYVELRGLSDLGLVKASNAFYEASRRRAAWRACLKFMQGEPGLDPALLAQIEGASGVFLEGPLVQGLFNLVVQRGDFEGAEALLAEAGSPDDLFGEYIRERVPYHSHWERLDQPCADGTSLGGLVLSKRGGHQMAWDALSRRIYLFGGWDGSQDLADLWAYSVDSGVWACLSPDTRAEGGPGPRSCHKICIHGGRRMLYVLGRFVEQDSRTASGPLSFANELWALDLDSHAWTLVSPDVRNEGGPPLVYDHQMVIDEERDLMYVFGGRIIGGEALNGEASYSGLYVYDIQGGHWQCLRPDASEHQPARSPALRSRIGHSMIHSPVDNRLYIFAGQRNKDYLSDFCIYDISTDTVVTLVKDTSREGGPEAGFTQRSTLDAEAGEIYLFTGLLRSANGPTPISNSGGNGVTVMEMESSTITGGGLSRNSFWVYNLTSRSWSRLQAASASPEGEEEWPCPRFAHQLVYDPADKCHYLFGGNPGEASAPKRRLNDLWRLRLKRPVSGADILRRATFLLRRQAYYELCLGRDGSTSLDALRYLQDRVSQAVRHDIPAESEEFRLLSGWLFQTTGAAEPAAPLAPLTAAASGFLSPISRSPILGLASYLAEPVDQIRLSREQLFADLTALLPRSLRPPTENLVDLVIPHQQA